MGLWDILVPTEPGVLHNSIANPSFEYDNVTTFGQTSGYTNGATNGLAYWTASNGTTKLMQDQWVQKKVCHINLVQQFYLTH